MSTKRAPNRVWVCHAGAGVSQGLGGSYRGGVGHTGVGWVMQGWMEWGGSCRGGVGVGWVMQGWGGVCHAGVGSVM